MGMKPTTNACDGPIENLIGTAYDVVKNVYDNIPLLESLDEIITTGGPAIIAAGELAFSSSVTAVNAANESEASAVIATTKAGEANTSAIAAFESETNAAASELNASNSAAQALANKELTDIKAAEAATAANNAIAAQDDVAANALAAATSEANALASENAASLSETNAANSETAAALSATTATNAATESLNSSVIAVAAKDAAAISESNAATSASNAQASENAAAISETNASTSELNAEAHKNAAALSESNAALSATNAATKATEALNSSTIAEAAKDAALLSETNAGISESNAQASAAAAALSETNAATSAAGALDSKNQAALSAENASVSETNASVSAANALDSENAAAVSAGNAATSEANALASYQAFQGQYYGTSAVEPTVDPLGNPIGEGDLYFDSVSKSLRLYNGSNWQLASTTIEGIYVVDEYTNVAGQSTFNVTYDVGLIQVLYNGVQLALNDFTANNSTSVVLNSPVVKADDVITLIRWGAVTESSVVKETPDGLSIVKRTATGAGRFANAVNADEAVVLGQIGNAALRTIGSSANQVPDKAVLDTRLGTSGNLGSAAQQNVMTSLTDAITPNALMPRGAFGLGGTIGTFISSANAALATGIYATPTEWAGSPNSGAQASNQGTLINIVWNENYSTQTFMPINTTLSQRIRQKDNGVWSSWKQGLSVGDYGLGSTYQGDALTPLVPSANLDGIGPMGHYRYTEEMAGKPTFGSGYGTLLNLPALNASGLNYGSQLVVDYAANEMGFRQLTGNVWSGWCRNYHNRNVVGVVVQSGGIPTGAIIESGSNANGVYVRYADGTQICYGGLTSVAGTQTWNFPAEFVPGTVIINGCSAGGASNAYFVAVSPPGISSVAIGLIRSDNATFAGAGIPLGLMAIGRWY